MRFLHPESPRLPARRTPASAQPPRGGSVPSSVCLDGMAVCRRSFEMSPSRSPDDAVAFVFPWRPGAVLRRHSWMRPQTEPFQSPSGFAPPPVARLPRPPARSGTPAPRAQPRRTAERANRRRDSSCAAFGCDLCFRDCCTDCERRAAARARIARDRASGQPFERAAAARRRRTTPPAERAPSRVEPVATRDGAQKARSMAGCSGRLGGDDGAPVAKPSRCT